MKLLCSTSHYGMGLSGKGREAEAPLPEFAFPSFSLAPHWRVSLLGACSRGIPFQSCL